MSSYVGGFGIIYQKIANRTALTDIIVGIRGYDSLHLPLYLSGKVREGTDVVVITKVGLDVARLIKDGFMGRDFLVVDSIASLAGSSMLLLTDDTHAELCEVVPDLERIENKINGKKNIIYLQHKLEHTYRTLSSTEIRVFTEVAYFVGVTDRRDAKGRPIYSLYHSVNRRPREELVPDIRGLHVTYGIDEQGVGRVSRYLKWHGILGRDMWAKVIVVALGLLRIFMCDYGKGVRFLVIFQARLKRASVYK